MSASPASLDPTLLALLACPSADHAPLRLLQGDTGETLVCTVCASEFDVRDGIPVLLLDEGRPGPRGFGVASAPGGPELQGHDPADAIEGTDAP